MQRTLFAVALVCATLVTAPASAQHLAGYDDRQNYDFALVANDATFHARVRLAARQACGERIGRVSLREWMQIRECKRDFVRSALSTAS